MVFGVGHLFHTSFGQQDCVYSFPLIFDRSTLNVVMKKMDSKLHGSVGETRNRSGVLTGGSARSCGRLGYQVQLLRSDRSLVLHISHQ